MRHFKHTLFLILGLLMPILSYAQSSNITVIFVDKTTSVTADAYIKDKNQSWLKKIIKTNTEIDGSKIIISYLFSNTASSSNRTEFHYTPPQESNRRLSSSQKRIAKMKYARRVRSYQQTFREKILTKALKKSSQDGTNIFGSIKVLADISQDNPQAKIKVYYISDLQECSKMRRLYCYGGIELESYKHAKGLAQKDLLRVLENYQLDEKCLQGISSISVVYPAKEMDNNTAFEMLSPYWEFFFKRIGVVQIKYY